MDLLRHTRNQDFTRNYWHVDIPVMFEMKYVTCFQLNCFKCIGSGLFVAVLPVIKVHGVFRFSYDYFSDCV